MGTHILIVKKDAATALNLEELFIEADYFLTGDAASAKKRLNCLYGARCSPSACDDECESWRLR